MNTFKNDINSAETTAEKKAKEMLTTLTSLSSSISSIELSIVDSNALLKETQDKLKNITSKIPLLQSIGMYHFNNEKDNLVKKFEGHITDLKKGKNQAQYIATNYKYCIDELETIYPELKEGDFKHDMIGILSVNRLKVTHIEQQIEQADNQIKLIDRYAYVTLHHINDSFNNGLKATPIKTHEELQKDINKYHDDFDKSRFINIILVAVFAILALYNYLASTYHITWTSIEKISSGREVDGFTSVATTAIPAMSSVLGFALIIYIGFHFMMNSRIPVFAVLMMPLTLIIPFIFRDIIGDETLASNENIVSTTKAITHTIDFFNLGFAGTFTFSSMAILTLSYIIYRTYKVNGVKNSISLLMDKTNIDQKSA